jgi:hypothetical protein
MRRLLLAAALAAGVLLPAANAIAAPGTADGSLGIRLVDIPTDRANDPRAHAYVIDHLAPGTTIERAVEVSNTTAAPMRVELYSAAASIMGGKFVGAEGRTPNDASTWTSVDPPVVTLAAGTVEQVTVTVEVPADAPPGEHYAAVWAEARAMAMSGGVSEVNRVGIRLYLDIGPGGEAASNFTIDDLTAGRTDDGKPVVSASVTNTGGRALDMSGDLTLSDGPAGLTAGPFPATLGTTIAPGDTEQVTVVLDDKLPNGPWDAHISLTSGLLTLSADGTITFPDKGIGAPVATYLKSSGGPAWPVLLGGGVAVGLIGFAFWVIARRRRRDRETLPA